MKLKIISDGTPRGSRVVVADTGEPVENVMVAEFRLTGTSVDVKLTFVAMEIDVQASFPQDRP